MRLLTEEEIRKAHTDELMAPKARIELKISVRMERGQERRRSERPPQRRGGR